MRGASWTVIIKTCGILTRANDEGELRISDCELALFFVSAGFRFLGPEDPFGSVCVFLGRIEDSALLK